MSFWDGITGTTEEAFAKPFVDVLPHGTKAIAKIDNVKIVESMGFECIQIDWCLTTGDFVGRYIFHKLHVFDTNKPEKAMRARNMLKLLLDMFHVKPLDNGPPTETFLKQLVGKYAGLKLAEWQVPRDDGTVGHGNNVAEVHPVDGFVTETGKYREFKENKSQGVESALTRNAFREYDKELNDDVPF